MLPDQQKKKTVDSPVTPVGESIPAIPETVVEAAEAIDVPVPEESVEIEIVSTPDEPGEVEIEVDKVDDIVAEIENIPVETIIPDTPPADQNAESNIGGAGRRSVANDEPQALRDAAENPAVREVIDLFSGVVIDVHR